MNEMMWLYAACWSGFAGLALVGGALVWYLVPLGQRLVAGIMAFGSGALISALSFELVGKSYESSGFLATGIGFFTGATIYTLVNLALCRKGAKHRKRSNISGKLDETQTSSNPLAIAVGALLDGIPESIVIGLGIAQGGVVSLVTVSAVLLSNIPEGLSSAAGMKNNNHKLGYVLLVWGGIALTTPLFGAFGYLFFSQASAQTISIITAAAAGAILAMVVDTMMPEAFEETHNFAGFITMLGFLAAFLIGDL